MGSFFAPTKTLTAIFGTDERFLASDAGFQTKLPKATGDCAAVDVDFEVFLELAGDFDCQKSSKNYQKFRNLGVFNSRSLEKRTGSDPTAFKCLALNEAINTRVGFALAAAPRRTVVVMGLPKTAKKLIDDAVVPIEQFPNGHTTLTIA